MFYEKKFYIILVPELTQSEIQYKLAGFTAISVFSDESSFLVISRILNMT